MTLKVLTWNVNGIRAREKEVLALLDEEKPDVACFQETKATPEQLPASLWGLAGLPDYHGYFHGKGGYSGVSVHLRKERFPEKPRFAHPDFDMESRVVEAHAGGRVFVSMYVPNGGKDYAAKIEFMKRLAGYPKVLAGEEVVLCGDLNVARAPADVYKNQRNEAMIGQRPDERSLFEELLEGQLVDVTRRLAPDAEDLFTWWPYWRNSRQRNAGWRIDYVLASPSLAEKADTYRVCREFGTSDHAPLIVTFG